jgi:hypothetical protein
MPITQQALKIRTLTDSRDEYLSLALVNSLDKLPQLVGVQVISDPLRRHDVVAHGLVERLEGNVGTRLKTMTTEKLNVGKIAVQ